MDRRFIYVLVALALSLPLIFQFSVPPVRMPSAEAVFSAIEKLPPRSNPQTQANAVFISLDFGPNSQAENLPQAEVVVEHLMRRRIPFILFSQYPLAESFLESIPATVRERLIKTLPDQNWVYGVDWVNLGYRPNSAAMIQNIAQSDDMAALLKKDTRGNKLSELPIFRDIRSLKQIAMLIQLSSLVGTVDNFLQFFQNKNHRPVFLHGCTSITIPQAFIYLDSGQLAGLLEGVAGAAWYSKLLSDSYPERAIDSSVLLNTSLGIAHLVIIILVILGNLMALSQRINSNGGGPVST